MSSLTKSLQSCYIGIDISKEFFEICMLNDNDNIIEAFTIVPDLNGFNKLLDEIPGDLEPRFGLENTGPLATNLIHFLEDKEQEIVVTNAFLVARLRDVFSPSVKNDPTDAWVIAKGLQMGVLKHSMKSKNYQYLQDALEYQLDLIKRKTMVTNQLRANLVEIFPEIEKIFTDVTCNASLAILENFPTAADLADSEKETVKELVREENGRISSEKLTKLLGFCQNSVGSKLEDIHKSIIISQVQELKLQKELLRKLDKRIEELTTAFENEIELLQSVPGVGDQTSRRFLAIVGNVKRFQFENNGRGAKRLLEFIGFGLREYSSGNKKQIGGITKRGNAKLRGDLYMAAMSAIEVDEDLRLKYENYLVRCGNGKKAMVAIARTLARRMFGVLKSGQAYDPNIPRAAAS